MKKAKRTNKPVNPEQIFNHAIRFSGTEQYLRDLKSTDSAFPVMVAPPSMVLSAFAIELLLKCLLALEGTEIPETYKLDVLFRRISHKKKRRIEELWDLNARSKVKQFCKAHGLPDDLPNAMVECASAFENMRYIYEEPETRFYIGDLGQQLIDVIVEIKPEWKPRQLNPAFTP